ncbi:MAG: hypothetical protein FRX48_06621 [Lasallia pustulata]|uniref:Uncharacterized protein n=1 Tax=Lasallia pustulata TaxID=136370 RepID=A0A5M8PKR1_9LECA|nr:MAG: hypothetical protein FRX48_06621 [Lasallia pustulata]
MPGEEDMAELSRELKMLRQANHLRFEFETHILHGGITQEDKEIRSPFTVKTMSALSLALSPAVITVMFIEAPVFNNVAHASWATDSTENPNVNKAVDMPKTTSPTDPTNDTGATSVAGASATKCKNSSHRQRQRAKKKAETTGKRNASNSWPLRCSLTAMFCYCNTRVAGVSANATAH